MARTFINMFVDNTNKSGYYIVEFIDNDGLIKTEKFNTDLDAKNFYDELMLEQNSPQS